MRRLEILIILIIVLVFLPYVLMAQDNNEDETTNNNENNIDQEESNEENNKENENEKIITRYDNIEYFNDIIYTFSFNFVPIIHYSGSGSFTHYLTYLFGIRYNNIAVSIGINLLFPVPLEVSTPPTTYNVTSIGFSSLIEFGKKTSRIHWFIGFSSLNLTVMYDLVDYPGLFKGNMNIFIFGVRFFIWEGLHIGLSSYFSKNFISGYDGDDNPFRVWDGSLSINLEILWRFTFS